MQIINPESPTLVLDGEEHEIEKLNENSKYYIDQYTDLNSQLVQLRAKMHQIEVARAGFISLLKGEITAQNNTFKDEATNEDLEKAAEEASS
tara:strand:- start:358 stop:633 length:276 start_codon:yes stop_codon:yes gene_type:complete